MSLCGISRRRLIAGTAAAAALSQVSAESLSIASAGREAVVYQTTSLLGPAFFPIHFPKYDQHG